MTLNRSEIEGIIFDHFESQEDAKHFMYGFHSGESIIAKDPTNDDAPFVIFSDGDIGLMAFYQDMGAYQCEVIGNYINISAGNMIDLQIALDEASDKYERFLEQYVDTYSPLDIAEYQELNEQI